MVILFTTIGFEKELGEKLTLPKSSNTTLILMFPILFFFNLKFIRLMSSHRMNFCIQNRETNVLVKYWEKNALPILQKDSFVVSYGFQTKFCYYSKLSFSPHEFTNFCHNYKLFRRRKISSFLVKYYYRKIQKAVPLSLLGIPTWPNVIYRDITVSYRSWIKYMFGSVN